MKKAYFLVVLFLCGLSVGNLFTSASAAAAAADNLGLELIRAAEKGNKEEIEELIAAGADVNAQDDTGWTALINTALKGRADIAEQLLDAGAKVNTQDFLGYTALMYAALNKKVDMVKLLISRGADKTIKNRGETAEEMARRLGHEKLANMIRDYGSGGRTKSAKKR